MNASETQQPEVSVFLAKRGKTELLPLPSLLEIDPKLIEIADRVAEISGSWNPVEIYTADPESIKKEKQEFLQAFKEGREYNPRFTYPYAESLELGADREALNGLLAEVRKQRKAEIANRNARVALYFKIKDDLATCDLVEGIQQKDEQKIRDALKRKYPGTDPVLLAFAQKEYEKRINGEREQPVADQEVILSPEEREFLEKTKFSDEEIKTAFKWLLARYGILKTDGSDFGFRVVVDEGTTAIDVRDKSSGGPTIFIPKGRTVTGEKLLSLMAHEIEGHARQSLNGERLFKIGGGQLKVDDETLYEGLAKRYDEAFSRNFFGTTEGVPLPFYALAVACAEAGGSFHDVFSEQLEMRLHIAFNLPAGESLPSRDKVEEKVLKKAMDAAWTTTYRVMRGHVDTTNPYGFAMAKDLSYLRG